MASEIEMVPESETLLSYLVARTERFKADNKFPIFRAPAHIRYSRQSDFEPKLVSIGPYYHGQKEFKSMENLKNKCVTYLLERRSEGGSNNSDVLEEPFRKYKDYARLYYQESVNYSDRDFVTDSCFIIRIILSFSRDIQSIAILDVNIKEVRSDLLLMENQIPLFFIEQVYNWFKSRISHFPEFPSILEQFLFKDMPWKLNNTTTRISNEMLREADHLLDLYWRCSADPKIIKAKFQKQGSVVNVSDIPNATVLHQLADIKFKKLKYNEKPEGLKHEGLQVFFRDGIMQMPFLKIDSNQTRLLVNLIAFEDSTQSFQTFNNYVKLMDVLIDSEKDVELLQQCGVIHNTMSSHTLATTFFNDIGNFCELDDKVHEDTPADTPNDMIPWYFSLHKDMLKYYNSKWKHRRASLRHNYCSSAWARLFVSAGIVLLILTVLQTYYTIVHFYCQNRQKYHIC